MPPEAVELLILYRQEWYTWMIGEKKDSRGTPGYPVKSDRGEKWPSATAAGKALEVSTSRISRAILAGKPIAGRALRYV